MKLKRLKLPSSMTKSQGNMGSIEKRQHRTPKFGRLEINQGTHVHDPSVLDFGPWGCVGLDCWLLTLHASDVTYWIRHHFLIEDFEIWWSNLPERFPYSSMFLPFSVRFMSIGEPLVQMSAASFGGEVVGTTRVAAQI